MNDENLKLVVEDDASKYTLPTRGVMVDVVRCQGVIPNRRDIMGLSGAGSARCTAAPVGVLVAKAPDPTMRVGALSVCLDCYKRAAEYIAEQQLPPAFAYNIDGWIRWVLMKGIQDILTEDGIDRVSPQYIVKTLGLDIPSVDGVVLIPRCLFPEAGDFTTAPKLVSLAAAMRALGLFPWSADMRGGNVYMTDSAPGAS